MAVYETTISSPAPVSVVCDYLADFRSCATWDPSVRSAELVSEGAPVRLGARFKVNAGGIPLTYEIVELDVPNRVVLLAKHAVLTSRDTITFTSRVDGGTDMTYHAVLDLRGPLRLADPLLRLVFGRVGDRAKAGLTRELAALPARV